MLELATKNLQRCYGSAGAQWPESVEDGAGGLNPNLRSQNPKLCHSGITFYIFKGT